MSLRFDTRQAFSPELRTIPPISLTSTESHKHGTFGRFRLENILELQVLRASMNGVNERPGLPKAGT